MASSLASSSIFLINMALASSWVMPETRSSSSTALLNGRGDLGFLDLEVLFLLGELALLLGQVAFLALDRLEPPLQVLLFAEKPSLGLVDLALFLPVLTLELVQAGEVFLAGLDGRFPLDLLSVLPGPWR